MKLAHLSIGLLALVSPFVAAWSKEGIVISFPTLNNSASFPILQPPRV